MNQREFSDKIGMKQTSYSNIETGRVSVSVDLLEKVISLFNVNPNFLHLGKHPMIVNESAEEALPLPPAPHLELAARPEGRTPAIDFAKLAQIRRKSADANPEELRVMVCDLLNVMQDMMAQDLHQKGQLISMYHEMEDLQKRLEEYR